MADVRPGRLQLSRKKGFNLQTLSLATNGLPAVNCARPSKFGNPFTIAGCRDAGFIGGDKVIAARCVEAFRVWIDTPYWRNNWQGPESERRRDAIFSGLSDLRAKNLSCFCKRDAPCHCDVLLEIANRPLVCEEVKP